MMVKIAKRGVVLLIHEDALAQHLANGWQEVVEAEKPDEEAPRRGRKPSDPSKAQEQ